MRPATFSQSSIISNASSSSFTSVEPASVEPEIVTNFEQVDVPLSEVNLPIPSPCSSQDDVIVIPSRTTPTQGRGNSPCANMMSPPVYKRTVLPTRSLQKQPLRSISEDEKLDEPREFSISPPHTQDKKVSSVNHRNLLQFPLKMKTFQLASITRK